MKLQIPEKLRNTPWMLSEQSLKMFSGLFVFFYLAKYLGVERFGQLNYTIAFVFIFFPLTQLGMFSILTRELTNNRERENEYLNTAFLMCLCASFLMFIICNILNFLINIDDDIVKLLIFIYSFSLFFKPFETIDFYFQSYHKAKISSIVRFIAVFITVVIKLILIYLEVNIYIIISSFLLEYLLVALFLSLAKIKYTKLLFKFQFFIDIAMVYKKSALPMVVSGLTLAIYSRMDQIMVKNLLSNYDLGLYSSATKLYDGVMTILFTITISLLPSLIQLKKKSVFKYENFLTQIFVVLFWSCIALAIFILFSKNFIIKLLYGEDFLDAATTLSICFFSLSFSVMGAITSRYFAVEKFEKKLLYRTLITLLINLILNYVLILCIGKEGAAIATLIALFIGNYCLDYFDRDLKDLVNIKNRALMFKIRQ